MRYLDPLGVLSGAGVYARSTGSPWMKSAQPPPVFEQRQVWDFGGGAGEGKPWTRSSRSSLTRFLCGFTADLIQTADQSGNPNPTEPLGKEGEGSIFIFFPTRRELR